MRFARIEGVPVATSYAEGCRCKRCLHDEPHDPVDWAAYARFMVGCGFSLSDLRLEATDEGLQPKTPCHGKANGCFHECCSGVPKRARAPARQPWEARPARARAA
jgi:hypothetical protein